MGRRSLFAVLGSALTGGVVVALASCSGETDEPARPPVVVDASTDTALIGTEASIPTPDAEPPAGDVCGIGSGLREGVSWPLRGGCTTRAGWSSQRGPELGQIYWSVPVLAGESSPAIGEGEVIWVGTTDGRVVAIANGAVRWAYRTGGPVKSSPAIDALGHAIVGGTDGFLYAFAAEDAPPDQDGGATEPDDAGAVLPSPRRVFALAVGPIASSPVIGGDGAIYVGTTDGKLVAVDKDGIGTTWTVTTNDTLGSSPALGQDGTIYVGSSDRKLYAVTPSGSVKWALDLGAPVSGSPAVGGDGTVYVGTNDGKLHAVASAGTERWSYATGGAITGTPAVYAGTAYVGSEDKQLHAVSTVDGAGRWKYATLGSVGTPVIASDGTIYVGSTDLRVYAITPKGSLFYALNAKSKIRTAPAIGAGQTLYVTGDNALVAISP